MKKKDSIIIRIPNWIGDAVIFTAFIKDLKKYFEKVYILAGKTHLKYLYEDNKYIDKIFLFDKNNIFSILKISKEIKKENIEFGVSLSPSLSSYFILFLSGIKYRYGFREDLGNIFLTKSYKRDKKHLKEHIIEEYYNVLKLIDSEIYIENKEQKQYLPIDTEYLKYIKEKYNINKDNINIFISPYADYGNAKIWPYEYYYELMIKLLNYSERINIFIARKKNYKKFFKIHDRINEYVDITLKEIIYIINSMNLFIGNDSGLMHIADALNIPLITIFGPTTPIWTGPLSENSKVLYLNLSCSPCHKRECPYKTKECMKKIKPDEVFNLAKMILKI